MCPQEEQPADFKYTHMWVSADGETHLKECAMKGFEMKKFAETEQWVKPTESPTKVRSHATALLITPASLPPSRRDAKTLVARTAVAGRVRSTASLAQRLLVAFIAAAKPAQLLPPLQANLPCIPELDAPAQWHGAVCRRRFSRSCRWATSRTGTRAHRPSS